MRLPILISIQRLALLVFAVLATTAYSQPAALRVEVVASGLQNPWGVAFIDFDQDGSMEQKKREGYF